MKPKGITNDVVKVHVHGYTFEVRGDYQPAERMTRDYPGCPAEFEIESITWLVNDVGGIEREIPFPEFLEDWLDDIENEALRVYDEALVDAAAEAAEREYDRRREDSRMEFEGLL